jgi:hypothetical protein
VKNTLAALLMVLVSVEASGQARIETRKLRTIVDRDGSAFVRPPMLLSALSRGRYALEEVNALPVVIDSTGRVIKRFGRGGGPGEFEYAARSFSVIGDTLYAANGQGFNVYSPDLAFLRSFLVPSIGAGPIARTPEGFVMSVPKYETRSAVKSLHVIRSSGELVRSFLADSVPPRTPSPSYRMTLSADGSVWVAGARNHRVEKWSVDGRRLTAIAAAPAWFDTTRQYADGRMWLHSITESDGILWIMTLVPVPNYRQVMAEAMKGRGGEVDARLIPEEKLSTTRIEAYDAKTGSLLADLPVKSFGVGFLSGRQFALYTTGVNDEPQIEIWEMKLRR